VAQAGGSPSSQKSRTEKKTGGAPRLNPFSRICAFIEYLRLQVTAAANVNGRPQPGRNTPAHQQKSIGTKVNPMTSVIRSSVSPEISGRCCRMRKKRASVPSV